jgi:hypothetical protein
MRTLPSCRAVLKALAETETPAVTGEGPLPGRAVRPAGPRKAVPHRKDMAAVEVLTADYQAAVAAALDAGTTASATGRHGWCWAVQCRGLAYRRSANAPKMAGRTGWLVEDKSGRSTPPAGQEVGTGRRENGS